MSDEEDMARDARSVSSPTGAGRFRPIDDEAKRLDQILAYSEHGCTGTLLVRWTALSEFLSDSEIEEYSREGMSDEALDEPDWFFADFCLGGRLSPDCYPTHYMPLPAPPAARNASEDTEPKATPSQDDVDALVKVAHVVNGFLGIQAFSQKDGSIADKLSSELEDALTPFQKG
jgi:hypothetical protein